MFDSSAFYLFSGAVLIFVVKYLLNRHTIKKLSNELGVSQRRIKSKFKRGWSINEKVQGF